MSKWIFAALVLITVVCAVIIFISLFSCVKSVFQPGGPPVSMYASQSAALYLFMLPALCVVIGAILWFLHV